VKNDVMDFCLLSPSGDLQFVFNFLLPGHVIMVFEALTTVDGRFVKSEGSAVPQLWRHIAFGPLHHTLSKCAIRMVATT
jgi:hypothetical protein